MESQCFLYETLTPLDATAAPETEPPSQSPENNSSDELETYVVLRNSISISADQFASTESAAADYFSLDVNELEECKEETGVTTPIVRTPAEASTPAPERTLEGKWFSADSRVRSPMLRLHREIVDFCDFLSPTPEEQESRNASIESVSDVIKYIWPNATVEVFGSFKTGLYLPSSDIDVVILGSNIRSPQTGLHALSRALSQRGIAKKIQVIGKARVPIIKFVERKSGISYDISFDAHNGPQAAKFIKDAVSKWPPLRPLCLILKVFLQQRELNEVYTGGIGSYALLAMLIAMLRQHRQASPEHNLGVLLVNFFDMYGRKLNTIDVGVSCNDGGTFFQKSSKGFSVEGRPSLISIEDPQAPENDIGKSSFNYYQVRSAFAVAFTALTNSKAILHLGPNRSILGTIIRPDAVLLERKGGPTGKVTFTNLFPGAGEPLPQLFEEDQEQMHYNWQLNGGEDEEPLPRSNGIISGGSDVKSSEKKRKSSRERKWAKRKKLKEIEGGDRNVENGSMKDSSSAKKQSVKDSSAAKKQRRRHNKNNGDSDGYNHYYGGSSTRTR